MIFEITITWHTMYSKQERTIYVYATMLDLNIILVRETIQQKDTHSMIKANLINQKQIIGCVQTWTVERRRDRLQRVM
jgi:hypothetical protein